MTKAIAKRVIERGEQLLWTQSCSIRLLYVCAPLR